MSKKLKSWYKNLYMMFTLLHGLMDHDTLSVIFLDVKFMSYSCLLIHVFIYIQVYIYAPGLNV